MTLFKVMTWNVENLFLPSQQSGSKTAAEYQEKLKSLADVILAIDPDVLGVQEIGDPAAFAALNALLEGRYPHNYLSQSPDRRGIRVGFLSKLKIEERADLTNLPEAGLSKVVGSTSEQPPEEITRMSRGAAHILVKPQPDLPVHIINAHFKSKLLTFTSSTGQPRFQPKDENERAREAGLALLRRTAEAVAVRVKVNELLEQNSGDAVIVLGDLNDTPSAATTQILQGPTGSEIDTNGFDIPDKGDKMRLFNLAARIDEKRRYSRIYRGNPELIDHIFVSEELLPGLPRKLPIVDSYLEAIESLPSIDDNPSSRHGKPGSDHLPIVATFDL
jgi:endonuclease/exonuclease/phosphatase family metal-dependent hydrolase